MKSRTLLRGGCVLTLGRTNFLEADVLIDGDIVAEIGPGLRARDAEVIDASNTIIMPGFVDTHRHVWQSLFRNLGDAISPDVYGPYYQPDDVYAATLIGLLGAIEAGISTVVDWSDISPGPEYLEAATQAHTDAGIRSVLVPAAPEWTDGRDALSLASPQSNMANPLMTMGAGMPSPMAETLGQIAEDWAKAREHGLRIHTHIGHDTSTQGVVGDLSRNGMLGKDVTFIQCTHLSDSDFDAVSSSGARVSLTPTSGMSGSAGSPPIQRLIDRGIRPGLGVGSDQMAPGDMFAQMRAVISIQHATLFELKLAGKAGVPNLLNTREVLRYATVDGARVAGLGETVGALAPGAQADLIVLRADRPNIFPINDPIGAVVWGMDTSNVDWVFVAGNAVKRAGVLQGDIGRATELATAAQQRVGAAAGLLATVGHSQ